MRSERHFTGPQAGEGSSVLTPVPLVDGAVEHRRGENQRQLSPSRERADRRQLLQGDQWRGAPVADRERGEAGREGGEQVTGALPRRPDQLRAAVEGQERGMPERLPLDDYAQVLLAEHRWGDSVDVAPDLEPSILRAGDRQEENRPRRH